MLRSRYGFGAPFASKQRSARQKIGSAAARAAGVGLRGIEPLEPRLLFNAAQDITQVTAMRADPQFSNINGNGIGIAVLDTGVYAKNPELQPNVVAFYNAISDPPTAPIDPNYINDAIDNVGHGSHVSGIAASSNPDIGVAYKAHLIDIRVFNDPGEAPLASDPILNGLEWVRTHAAAYNIKVVNMSLGEPGVNLDYVPPEDVFAQAIHKLEAIGITVVSASGNSYANDPQPGASIPAVDSTISVANTWATNGSGADLAGAFGGGPTDQYWAYETQPKPDEFAATSQRSTLDNQLAAPGSDILSDWNSPTMLHNVDSGTSMASPFVAGTVALMQQESFATDGQYLQPYQVLQILRKTADNIVDYNDPTNGRYPIDYNTGGFGPAQNLPETGLTYKRVNVYRAIQEVHTEALAHTGIGGDTNNTLATAVVIPGLNGSNTPTYDASIGNDGQVYVGNTDVDLYKITLAAQGDLQITVNNPTNSASFSPAIELFDSTGAPVQATTNLSNGTATLASITGQPLAPGTYYVGVSSVGNTAYNPVNGSGATAGVSTGDYHITFSLTVPDPNGLPALSTAINLTQPNDFMPTTNIPANHVSGIIGSDLLPDGTRVRVDNGDVDFYSVVPQDNGVLRVQVSADARLFDESLTQLGQEGGNITANVVAGHTYYIGVTTPLNAGFDPLNPYNRAVGSSATDQAYDLYVSFSNGDSDGTAPQAAAATVGTPLTGDIGTDNGVALSGTAGKDVDFYSFTAPAAGVLDVSAAGNGGFTPAISIWQDTNGIQDVSKLVDIQGNGQHLQQQVAAGQKVIVAITSTANDNFNGIADGTGLGGPTGMYTLTTTMLPPTQFAVLANNSIQANTATPITLNTPVPGDIGNDGTLVIGPTDVDVYSFTAPDTREYTFATHTSQDGSADTVMRVFNSAGQQIAFNDNATNTTTGSSVSVSMTAGQTYYIGIDGAGPGALNYDGLTGQNSAAATSTGPYTLTATDTGPYQRMVNFQAGQRVAYTDANGSHVVLTLHGPGGGQLIFDGTGNADAAQILLNGTDAHSVLTIHGDTSVGDVISNGSLGSFIGRTVDLTGNFSVAGSVARVQLRSAGSGKTISIGAGGSLAAVVGSVGDDSLTSIEPIKSLTVGSWGTAAGTAGTINSPVIDLINCRGDFHADVITGTLGRLKVGGAITGSNVSASKDILNVMADSVVNSEIFAGAQSSLTALPSSTGDFASVDSQIRSVVVRGHSNAFSNSFIVAPFIGNVTIASLNASNGGTPFGVGAHSITSLRVGTSAGQKMLKHLIGPATDTVLEGDAIARLV